MQNDQIDVLTHGKGFVFTGYAATLPQVGLCGVQALPIFVRGFSRINAYTL